MKVNPRTLLFERLSVEEVNEMRSVVENIVLYGVTPNRYTPWIDEWMKVAKFESKDYLLAVATALPQRILISLLRQAEGRNR